MEVQKLLLENWVHSLASSSAYCSSACSLGHILYSLQPIGPTACRIWPTALLQRVAKAVATILVKCVEQSQAD